MSFPNVSQLRTVDTDRRNAMAINHLLSRPSYLILPITGKPSAGQVLFSAYLPMDLVLLASEGKAKAGTGATGSPAFALKINGSAAGSVTFSGTAGTYSITTANIPANALFEVVAPNPQDATLSDITLSIAVGR